MEYEVGAAPHYPDKVHKIFVAVYTRIHKHNHVTRRDCPQIVCFKMEKIPFASSQYYKLEKLEGSLLQCMF